MRFFGGQGSVLSFACGNIVPKIYTYTFGTPLRMVLKHMLLLLVGMFACLSQIAHPLCQHILLAALSECIQNSMTSHYFQYHHTSLSYHHCLLLG